MDDLFAPTIARASTPSSNNSVNTNSRTNTSNTTSGTSGTDMSSYVKDTSGDNLALTMEDFLQLMIVQFQNQDIDNPASTSDMMNQLMQMSTIQAMATMTDASTMSYAASLVGKTVTIGEFTNGRLNEIVGEVTASATYNGEQVIFVNGKQYALTSIMAVGELPDVEEDTTTPGVGDTEETPETGDTTTPDTGETEGTDTATGDGESV